MSICAKISEQLPGGEAGKIRSIDRHAQIVEVVFDDDKIVEYPFAELDDLDLAYAITVHKSQGSEFPVVIIPMYNFPPMLMTRNLLYTAVTRGKGLVLIVGDPGRLRSMIDNNRADERYTGLKERLILLDADPFVV